MMIIFFIAVSVTSYLLKSPSITDVSDFCFEVSPETTIGNKSQGNDTLDTVFKSDISHLYNSGNRDIFIEEAEQSRLMTAISAGQELMASYFELLIESGHCAVAQMKIIEWKLNNHGWWIKRRHHDYMPCLCPVHNRTPLDVLWLKMAASKQLESAIFSTVLVDARRTSTTQDFQKIRSSFIDAFTN